jgi:hypothetical protein
MKIGDWLARASRSSGKSCLASTSRGWLTWACDSTYCEKQINSTNSNFLYCSELYVLFSLLPSMAISTSPSLWMVITMAHTKAKIADVDSRISRPRPIRIANACPRPTSPLTPLSPLRYSATPFPSPPRTDLTLYLARPPPSHATAPTSPASRIPTPRPCRSPNLCHIRAFQSALLARPRQAPTQPPRRGPPLLASVNSPPPCRVRVPNPTLAITGPRVMTPAPLLRSTNPRPQLFLEVPLAALEATCGAT